MRTLVQDLRFGWRSFLSSPGFTAVTVLTLALGIAFNTTVFSWVNSLLLRPFPGATGGDRLAVMVMATDSAPNGGTQTSYLDYRDYCANLKSLAGLAVHREDVFSLGTAANSQAVWVELVSGNYFAVLGVKPALGRVFTPQEDGDQPGAYPVAVISHGLWRRRFHADPGAIGKILRRGMGLTAIGLAGGLAVSLVATRLIAGMLVNVSATDPATFAGGSLFLVAVAALASYLPARRATKVDPMVTLRSEWEVPSETRC